MPTCGEKLNNTVQMEYASKNKPQEKSENISSEQIKNLWDTAKVEIRRKFKTLNTHTHTHTHTHTLSKELKSMT